MGAEQFGAAWTELVEELDWARLGRTYCDGDGSDFFDDELRGRVLETGLELADELASALPRGGPRRSLYFGAAVAELPVILAESVALGREVCWLNLPGEELDELVRALRAVSARLALQLPHPSVAAIESVERASCDHLWMTSVLTDPEAFPALHDELYERRGSELATGRGSLSEERQRADDFVRALLARAAPPALLTTTEEELTLVRPQLASAGLSLRAPRAGRLSAIVGDSVLVTRLSAAPWNT